MKLLAIKYGGHAMDDPLLNKAFAESLVSIQKQGWDILVGHGGGPAINAMLDTLGIKSKFHNGLRVTDQSTMYVVEMVLAGHINPFVVSLFCKAGLRAVGLTGKDARTVQAFPMGLKDGVDMGLVGENITVNPALVRTLLENGYTPVVAPIAYGPEGRSLNINADTATGALAGALCADAFLLVTDVEGVRGADGQRIPSLSRKDALALMDSGVISGGMIPKVQSCLDALDAGCRKAVIFDGRAAGNLEILLSDDSFKAQATTITH